MLRIYFITTIGFDDYGCAHFVNRFRVLIKQEGNDQGNYNSKHKKVPVPVNFEKQRFIIKAFVFLNLLLRLIVSSGVVGFHGINFGSNLKTELLL